MRATRATAPGQGKARPGRVASRQPRAPPTGTFRTDVPGINYGFLSEALAFPLRDAQILIEERYLSTLPSGVEGGQFMPFLIIGANVGIRQRDLAHILGLAHSAVVVLINKFSQMGLVRRAIVPTDQRVYEIYLTREGWETYEALTKAIEQHDAQVSALFSAAERERLISLLKKVAEFEQV